MSYLLDSHTLIWWLGNSTKLSTAALNCISSPNNIIYVSHASYWEISIKVSIGRLRFPINDFEKELANNRFELLPIKTTHIAQSAQLPMHHRDPFDRLLIAQAKVEELTLVTVDELIHKYDCSWLW